MPNNLFADWSVLKEVLPLFAQPNNTFNWLVNVDIWPYPVTLHLVHHLRLLHLRLIWLHFNYHKLNDYLTIHYFSFQTILLDCDLQNFPIIDFLAWRYVISCIII